MVLQPRNNLKTSWTHYLNKDLLYASRSSCPCCVSARIVARGTTDHTAEIKVMHLEENFLNYQCSSSNKVLPKFLAHISKFYNKNYTKNLPLVSIIYLLLKPSNHAFTHLATQPPTIRASKVTLTDEIVLIRLLYLV